MLSMSLKSSGNKAS